MYIKCLMLWLRLAQLDYTIGYQKCHIEFLTKNNNKKYFDKCI